MIKERNDGDKRIQGWTVLRPSSSDCFDNKGLLIKGEDQWQKERYLQTMLDN